jgi:hypothetical protein
MDRACVLRHFPRVIHNLIDFSRQAVRLARNLTRHMQPRAYCGLEGVGSPADEGIVKPPVTPQEEEEEKDDR